jgi:NitT/TauT family transport system substrate-binding protein
MVRAALALALFLSLLSQHSAADTTLIVGKANATADNVLPADVGDRLGIFRKHGLDLKIVDFTGGSRMMQAMAAGDIDIAAGAGTEMAFIAKGVPMLAVCETATTLSYLAVGVPWESPIKTKADLKGKRIGISSPGSLTDWLAKELARKEGWGPDGLSRIAVGGGVSSATAAFRAHLIDAYVGGTTTFLDMAEKRYGRLLIPVSDYEGNIGSGVAFASDRLMETKPDAIRAFLAAWIETTQYMRAHKAETVKLESSITGFSESVTSQDYDIVQGMYTSSCALDAQSLATLRRSFVELGLLSEAPDMSKLYTDAYMPR